MVQTLGHSVELGCVVDGEPLCCSGHCQMCVKSRTEVLATAIQAKDFDHMAVLLR